MTSWHDKVYEKTWLSICRSKQFYTRFLQWAIHMNDTGWKMLEAFIVCVKNRFFTFRFGTTRWLMINFCSTPYPWLTTETVSHRFHELFHSTSWITDSWSAIKIYHTEANPIQGMGPWTSYCNVNWDANLQCISYSIATVRVHSFLPTFTEG